MSGCSAARPDRPAAPRPRLWPGSAGVGEAAAALSPLTGDRPALPTTRLSARGGRCWIGLVTAAVAVSSVDWILYMRDNEAFLSVMFNIVVNVLRYYVSVCGWQKMAAMMFKLNTSYICLTYTL